jgi:endonuclease YncB( thermonuclease family)
MGTRPPRPAAIVLACAALLAVGVAPASGALPKRARVSAVGATGTIAVGTGKHRVTLRLAGTVPLRASDCGAAAAVAGLRARLLRHTVAIRGRASAARLTLSGRDVNRMALGRGLLKPAVNIKGADRSAASTARRGKLGLWGCRRAAPDTLPAAPAIAPAPLSLVDDVLLPGPAPVPVTPSFPTTIAGAYDIGTVMVTDLWVDPVNGSDVAAGTTRATALRTLDAAWRLIPQATALTTGVRIRILPGTIAEGDAPNYWEDRWGTASAPVIVEAENGPGTAHLPPINAYGLRYAYFLDIGIENPNDPFHCERCDHLLLRDVTLHGSDAHETLKVNQSTNVFVEGSTIGGADDNAIDFVAVRGGHLRANTVGPAGDWCSYAKGGSAQLIVQANHFKNCGTGGFVAGQGTGLQFMEAPFTHYEAYGIAVLDNLITDVEGAGVGVNGGFDVLVAHNTMYNVGSRGHALEVAYGRRSCDGQPGDDGRERCRQLLDGGAWGTTRVDDGDNFVRIPNRHVLFSNNLIFDPGTEPGADELVHLDDPYAGAAQDGSGLGAVVADDDVHFTGNVLWYTNGSGTVSGLSGAADTAFLNDNTVNVGPPALADPEHGDFHPAPGSLPAGAVIPAFGAWDVPGGEPYAGVGADTSHTLDGVLRTDRRPGAY